jgi:hypothetical protein
MAWSPDGTRIVTTSEDNTARVWDAQTGEELFSLIGHEEGVWPASWSPDGTRILTGSEDNTARVWDAQTGEELFSLIGHEDWVLHATWSPDGTRILTAAFNGTSRVWDAQTGVELASMAGYAVWSPDGKYIFTTSFDTVKMWPAWQSWKEAAEHLRECCVRRELTLQERLEYSLSLEPIIKLAVNTDEIDYAVSVCTDSRAAQQVDIAPACERVVELALESDDVDKIVSICTDREIAEQVNVTSVCEHAVKLAIETEDAALNHSLCWFGSTLGFAEIVMPACDHVVELDPGGIGINGRALARALTGDYEGAIEDFRLFIERAEGTDVEYRIVEYETWIAALEAGKNPFDEETLQDLWERNQP